MDDLKTMGVGEGDLVTHSFRKGVATMVASGCTVSPPTVLIRICNGWIMGETKYEYLFRECAGDQYFGPCAFELIQMEINF